MLFLDSLLDDPAKTVEDRCLGAGDRAESLGAIGQQLPLR